MSYFIILSKNVPNEQNCGRCEFNVGVITNIDNGALVITPTHNESPGSVILIPVYPYYSGLSGTITQ